jgi:hypothetical protein
MSTGHARIVARTQHWLESTVIGLNLCPFAKAVHAKQQIDWRVSTARSTASLLRDLDRALRELAAADPQAVDTTVLIHPWVLRDFDDYNQFLDVADQRLAALGLDGVLQIASFHPQYRFAGEPDDAISHCTNRSPYPLLHLLREASIERAVAGFADAERIVERNLETLRKLGWPGWQRLQPPQ